MWGGQRVHLFLQASTFNLLQTSAVTWTWNSFNANFIATSIHRPPLRRGPSTTYIHHETSLLDTIEWNSLSSFHARKHEKGTTEPRWRRQRPCRRRRDPISRIHLRALARLRRRHDGIARRLLERMGPPPATDRPRDGAAP